jgi:hypothetical protein
MSNAVPKGSLELRRGREIEAQLGLWHGHGTTSTGSIASAGN